MNTLFLNQAKPNIQDQLMLQKNQLNISHQDGNLQSQNLDQLMESAIDKQTDEQQLAFMQYQQQQQLKNLQAIQMVINTCPIYDEKMNYCQELMKVYIANQYLHNQIQELFSDRKQLRERINNLEKLVDRNDQDQDDKNDSNKKKLRRTAQEIDKNYVCPYENCQKGYGSDVSLNLHIKIKHNGGSKTEREKLAKAIMMAKINQYSIPKLDIEFPPGYLENFENYSSKDESEKKISCDQPKYAKRKGSTHLIHSSSKESDSSTQSESHHHYMLQQNQQLYKQRLNMDQIA